MRVSFDLDDTAWKYPEFFRALALALVEAGHEVGILTGHGDNVRHQDYEMWVKRGFPNPSFILNADDCLREGIQCHGVPQREWKLTLAAKARIDCHIDDFGNLNNFRLELCLLNQPDQSKE